MQTSDNAYQTSKVSFMHEISARRASVRAHHMCLYLTSSTYLQRMEIMDTGAAAYRTLHDFDEKGMPRGSDAGWHQKVITGKDKFEATPKKDNWVFNSSVEPTPAKRGLNEPKKADFLVFDVRAF